MTDRASGTQVESQFRQFVGGLTEDEKLDLVVLYWIGRESFSADEYEEALETARSETNNRTEEYLLDVPLLADYLENGLEAMGISASRRGRRPVLRSVSGAGSAPCGPGEQWQPQPGPEDRKRGVDASRSVRRGWTRRVCCNAAKNATRICA